MNQYRMTNSRSLEVNEPNSSITSSPVTSSIELSLVQKEPDGFTPSPALQDSRTSDDPALSSPSSLKPDGFNLHPVLQAALDSLDINLDDELARYRQQASGRTHQATSQASSSHHLTDPPGAPHSPGANAFAIVPSSTAVDSTEPLKRESDGSGAIASRVVRGPDDYLESSEELIRSLDEMDLSSPDDCTDEGDSPAARSSFFATLLTPLGIGSMLLLVLSSATLGYLVFNSSVLRAWKGDQAGDRPVASSTTAPDASDGQPSGLAPNLSLGEFSRLDLENLSTIPSGAESTPFDEIAGSPSESLDAAESAEIAGITPPPPTPGTLTPTTPTSTQPSSVAAAPAQRPVARQRRAATPSPTPRAAAPATLPAVTPAPAQPAAQPNSSSAPVPSPSPSATTAARPESSSNSDYVYVVTPYTGDQSLQQAQQAVSGAYVRNFSEGGAQVQMGAFSSQERARSLVQELNDQGIPAQIYDR